MANADANNLAVIDVSRRGQSRSLGFIPVGWYPTSVRMSAEADRILVANGKGLISKANPPWSEPAGEEGEGQGRVYRRAFSGRIEHYCDARARRDALAEQGGLRL